MTAEVDRALELNEIGAVKLVTSRPLIFDAYADVPSTGSFILIDADSNFTAGAGMILPAPNGDRAGDRFVSAADRLAAIARAARTPDEAAAAIRNALEDLLR